MNIQHLIIFCVAQIIGLIIILLRKKFRTLPNLLLKLVFASIITHYIYYYFVYEGLVTPSSILAYIIIPFSTIAPPLVYYYAMSVMYGKINFTKISLLHLVPILLNTAIFVLFIQSTSHKETLIFLAKSITISLYFIYPILIIKMIGNFYNIKGITLSVFKYNKKKTTLIRLLWSMMLLHFFILVLKNNLPLFIDGTKQTMDIINLCFLMLLGYALSYVIISEPKTIHLANEKIGLGGFKKYDKSKLTREMAEENARNLNRIMENEKPYLDTEFNLSDCSKLCNLPTHTISETLNGLMNQTFNDYINNYRVEEFKKIALQKEYKNYTILALAFEAGFKSKATFNASFKKFTGKTPSEYIKSSVNKQ